MKIYRSFLQIGSALLRYEPCILNEEIGLIYIGIHTSMNEEIGLIYIGIHTSINEEIGLISEDIGCF